MSSDAPSSDSSNKVSPIITFTKHVEPRYDINGNKMSPEQISEFRILMQKEQDSNFHTEDNAYLCPSGQYSTYDSTTGGGTTCGTTTTANPAIRLLIMACPRRLGTAVPENLLTEEEMAELALLPDSVPVPPLKETERYTRTIGTLTYYCTVCSSQYYCDGYNYYICPAGESYFFPSVHQLLI